MERYRLMLPAMLIVVFAAFMQSCSKPIDRTGFMPPVKIHIPNGVKNDTATVAFMKSSERLINALSDHIENIARNGKDILNKDEKDLTVMEKLQMAKLNVQFLAAGGSLANEFVKVQNYIGNKQKQGVSKTDMKAYKTVEKAIEKRIMELNKKYKYLINK